MGIAVDIAALALGAEYFERHFTLDRTWKGTDHAASLEPTGLLKLARDLRNTAKALKYSSKDRKYLSLIHLVGLMKTSLIFLKKGKLHQTITLFIKKMEIILTIPKWAQLMRNTLVKLKTMEKLHIK